MVEAFVGVIYAGFCGAILFGKVLRFQSRAPVIFSDPLVIRLSTSITSVSSEKKSFFRRSPEDEESMATMRDSTSRGLVDPPILEFRLVNLLHDELAGEIIGASLQVVASKNADDTDPQILEFSSRERNKSIEQQQLSASRRSNSGSTGSQEAEMPSPKGIEIKSDNGVRSSKTRLKQSILRGLRPRSNSFQPNNHKADVTTYDGGNRALIPKIIFSNIHIEEPQHPLFKRVWVGQHVLDETSPLLKDKVKSKVRKRQGLWPRSQCTAARIKKSLDFNQIIVSITGVSNVTGSEVYAHHLYDFNDVIVGYEFVDILLQENSGAIKVDMGGLHCVVGQFEDQYKDYMDSFE